MRPPEFGSSPSNEMGFPRKNAARRARGISFEGNPFSIIRIYKIWGSSYKGSPPKIVSLRAAQGFFRCAVRQHGASIKIPRSPSPAKRNPEPISPTGEAMRFADAKRASASFLQNARRGRIQFIPKKNGTAPKKCALRAAFLSVAVPYYSI